VERAVILSESATLEINDFPFVVSREEARTSTTSDAPKLDAIEKQAISQALKIHGRNMSRVAKALGLTRASLYRRMEKYGL
jgi:transcriptional regulator of acetoin/glycerol metabolism